MDQDNSRASAIRLTDIPMRVTDDSFLRAKTGKMRDSHQAGYRELSRAAEHIARPKALFLPASPHIHKAGTPSVEILGHIVQSPVVHANLRGLNRVFVFVITCGQELREWKESLASPLDRFFADLICEHALQTSL